MLDREAFLKSSPPERVVELSTGSVRVRGISRAEALTLKGQDLSVLEPRIIQFGLVEPELSAADVDEWYLHANCLDVDIMVRAISELSGLSAAAPKSDVPGVTEQPRSGV